MGRVTRYRCIGLAAVLPARLTEEGNPVARRQSPVSVHDDAREVCPAPARVSVESITPTPSFSAHSRTVPLTTHDSAIAHIGSGPRINYERPATLERRCARRATAACLNGDIVP